jgi:hypothetical protein
MTRVGVGGEEQLAVAPIDDRARDENPSLRALTRLRNVCPARPHTCVYVGREVNPNREAPSNSSRSSLDRKPERMKIGSPTGWKS